MSLYQITAEMVSLMAAFNDHGKDSAEAESAFREHAAALAEAFDEKADDYAALIRSCETRAAARREESERIRMLADSDDALAHKLRDAMRSAMEATGRTRVDTPKFRLSVRQNGGKIPVLIEDPDRIPTQYQIPRMTTVIDKEAIRAALEKGEAVSGAALGTRGSRLDIR